LSPFAESVEYEESGADKTIVEKVLRHEPGRHESAHEVVIMRVGARTHLPSCSLLHRGAGGAEAAGQDERSLLGDVDTIEEEVHLCRAGRVIRDVDRGCEEDIPAAE